MNVSLKKMKNNRVVKKNRKLQSFSPNINHENTDLIHKKKTDFDKLKTIIID